MSLFKNREYIDHFTPILLWGLILAEKIRFYLQFSRFYSDSDQMVLWLQTLDMLNGGQWLPFFYGQTYNPIIEPLLALPLVHAGMHVSAALPLVSTILGLLPFILFAQVARKVSGKKAYLLALCLPLLLAPEHLILSSISRGFTAGIAFGMCAWYLFVIRPLRFSYTLSAFLFVFSVFINPNSLLLAPLFLPYIPKNITGIGKLLSKTAAGWLAATLLWWISLLPYQQHPDWVIHPKPSLQFGWEYALSVLGRLDNFFDFVQPLFWRFGWMGVLLIILLFIWRYRCLSATSKQMGYIVFIGLFLSFFLEKVADGTNSAFFSGARMFLGWPFLCATIAYAVLQSFNPKIQDKLRLALITLAVVSFSSKWFFHDAFMREALEGNKNSVVEVVKISELKKRCSEIIEAQPTDIIIAASSETPDQMITYGCPCLIEDFPPTWQPLYERRAWLNRTYQQQHFPVLFIHSQIPGSLQALKFENRRIMHSDPDSGWYWISAKDALGTELQKLGIKSPQDDRIYLD